VMDAANAFETQDLQIADLVEREGRALIYCIAKWDLVEEPQARLAELRETAERMLPQLRGAPLVALSAETGRGLERLMPAVLTTYKNWSVKVKTRDLNDWLAMAVQRHPPPAVNGRRIKPKYAAQLKGSPPTFVMFASRAEQMPDHYRRYLINSIRESFDLPGVPIRITIKSGKNPYADAGDGNRKQGGRSGGPTKFEAKKAEQHRKAAKLEEAKSGLPRVKKPVAAKPVVKKSVAKAIAGAKAAKAKSQRTPTTHKLRKGQAKSAPKGGRR
jgi:GTP-binding protein